MLSRETIASSQKMTFICAFLSMVQEVPPFACLGTPCFSTTFWERTSALDGAPTPLAAGHGRSATTEWNISGPGGLRRSMSKLARSRGGGRAAGPDVWRVDGPVNVPKRLPPGGASSFWDRVRERERLEEGPRPTEVLQLGAAREHSATVRRENLY